jgi:hypothetical protein
MVPAIRIEGGAAAMSMSHDYSYEREGEQLTGEEFVAKKTGHDTARTRYDVDRTPRHRDVPPERAQKTCPVLRRGRFRISQLTWR